MHAYQPERLNSQPFPKNPLLEVVSTHPSLCAGAAVSLAVMCAIFVNAVWYQPGKHPAPLFATRVIEDTGIDNKKTAAVAKPAKKKTVLVKAAPAETSAEILTEVQTALSVRGYYTGKLDGVYGSRTKKAITAFQKDHSLKPDGQATVRLLTQVLMSASSRPQDVPVPKQSQLAENSVKVKTVAFKPTEEAATQTTSVAVKEAPAVDGLIAQIQSGLRAYGYDDLVVDGKMGQQTATAIQRFQLDYGMKITGEPSDSVLTKLREIGAYTQG